MVIAQTGALVPLLLAVNISHADVASEEPTTDQVVSALVHALEGESTRAIADAVTAAKDTASTTAAAAALIDALRAERSVVRTNAALALGMLPEEAAQLVPALTAALGDTNVSVRINAASSLSAIARATIRRDRKAQHGIPFKDSVAPLAAALNDPDEAVRSNAAAALANLGALAKPAEPILQGKLKDGAELVRVNAALALWRVSENNKDIVLPVLRDGVSSQRSSVRLSAISALEQMGPAAAQSQKELRGALRDDDELVRRNAASALGSIGPEASDAVPDLLKALRDKSEYVRLLAAEAIFRIRRDAGGPAIDTVSRIMQDADADFMLRIHAIEMMTRYAERRVAIRAIEQLLSAEDNPVVRASAAEALAKLQEAEQR